MELYMGRRRDVGRGYWMSFENNPRLAETKSSLYLRCVPCLEKLFSRLQGNPDHLLLEEPLNCWKVVVVLNSFTECLDLLQAYQDKKFPVSRVVRGRVGTNNKDNPGVVVIFYLYSEEEREELFTDMERIVPGITSFYDLYYERGCLDLYGILCGDWRDWAPLTTIKNPHQVAVIREKVGRLLKGQYS